MSRARLTFAACMRLSRSSSVMGFASPKGLLLDDVGAMGAATASTGRVLQMRLGSRGARGGSGKEKNMKISVVFHSAPLEGLPWLKIERGTLAAEGSCTISVGTVTITACWMLQKCTGGREKEVYGRRHDHVHLRRKVNA
jgi:hypothetical protein